MLSEDRRADATVTARVAEEGDLIRKTIIPTVYYCLAAGALSFIWIFGFGFNAGTIQLLLLVLGLVLVVLWLRRRAEDPRTPHGEDHGGGSGSGPVGGATVAAGTSVTSGTSGTSGTTSNGLTAAERETPGAGTYRGAQRPPVG